MPAAKPWWQACSSFPRRLTAALFLCSIFGAASGAEIRWAPGTGDIDEHRSVFVMPGEPVAVTVDALPDGEPQLHITTGKVTGSGLKWTWLPGDLQGSHAALVVRYGNYSLRVQLFELMPFDAVADTHLGEFEIGEYPPDAEISGLPYKAPAGLLRVTERTQDLHVSPRFQLRQFLCKQEGGWPKYIVPSADLYRYLEVILSYVNEKGIDVDTLHVMSGYRTPFYNAEIKNVQYSRHIYGDAADLFIDADNDNEMDDLDGDGSIDMRDAELFANWIREALQQAGLSEMPGGMGIYAERSWRGPFVHFDIRGREVSWTSS